MNTNEILAEAIKWKHPKARCHTIDGKIDRWSDPDGAAQPDESILIAEYLASGAVTGTMKSAKDEKYVVANKEYVRRGIILTGAKVRGSRPAQALMAIVMKDTHRGHPNADSLATLHDKLEALKDLIEAADQSALDAIEPMDDSHWA